MALIKICDNQRNWVKIQDCVPENNLQEEDIEKLSQIANKKISELNKISNLLIFPRDYQHGDKILDQEIISIKGKSAKDAEICTGNIMGFVGINNTQLDIRSRFAKDNEEDYFMHYMLQKVFKINILSLMHGSSKEPIFDFLMYLFPYYLKKSIAQGLFKKYHRNEYNNANVRGTVDVSRHIRKNIPFEGKVAYNTREHSYDNEITQLIRHTIEYMRTKTSGNYVLNCDAQIKMAVAQIVKATPTYYVKHRSKIINQNLRPFSHPYYTEYKILHNLCLKILRHEAIKFGNEKDKINGVLFDGAWLWEEYLWTILEDNGFIHPQIKKKERDGGLRMFKQEEDDLFKKNFRKLYPDFYKEENGEFKIILDAKYKNLDQSVGREDLYQVVSYMYCTKSPDGGYIYPTSKEQTKHTCYQLNGHEGVIHVFPFYIPNESKYEEFVEKIKNSEINLLDSIKHPY